MSCLLFFVVVVFFFVFLRESLANCILPPHNTYTRNTILKSITLGTKKGQSFLYSNHQYTLSEEANTSCPYVAVVSLETMMSCVKPRDNSIFTWLKHRTTRKKVLKIIAT